LGLVLTVALLIALFLPHASEFDRAFESARTRGDSVWTDLNFALRSWCSEMLSRAFFAEILICVAMAEAAALVALQCQHEHHTLFVAHKVLVWAKLLSLVLLACLGVQVGTVSVRWVCVRLTSQTTMSHAVARLVARVQADLDYNSLQQLPEPEPAPGDCGDGAEYCMVVPPALNTATNSGAVALLIHRYAALAWTLSTSGTENPETVLKAALSSRLLTLDEAALLPGRSRASHVWSWVRHLVMSLHFAGQVGFTPATKQELFAQVALAESATVSLTEAFNSGLSPTQVFVLLWAVRVHNLLLLSGVAVTCALEATQIGPAAVICRSIGALLGCAFFSGLLLWDSGVQQAVAPPEADEDPMVVSVKAKRACELPAAIANSV